MNAFIQAAGILIAAITPITAFAGIGDYQKIECSTQSFFASNSCQECFDGGSVSLNTPISGLYDTWTNLNPSEQLFYKNEIKYPEILSIGSANSQFVQSPATPEQLWKVLPNDTWTPSAGQPGKEEFVLGSGKKITFIEANFGGGYRITSTNAKGGEYVAMIRFPLVYRDVKSDGNESEPKTHNECVAYKLTAQAAATPTPTTPIVPKEVTRVKTGPESFLFLSLALIIAALIAITRRKSRI